MAILEMLWGERRENGIIVAATEPTGCPMPQPNDLSRSLVALDENSTLIAVIEMSQSSWLIAGIVPGVERSSCCIAGAGKRRRPGAISIG